MNESGRFDPCLDASASGRIDGRRNLRKLWDLLEYLKTL